MYQNKASKGFRSCPYRGISKVSKAASLKWTTLLSVEFLEVGSAVHFNYQNMTCSRQSGLSLIELMISLLLSSLIIVAMLSFFSNFKANTFLQSSVVDNQHELRIVSDFIRSEVQKAGYRNEESPNQDPFSQNVPGFFEASRYLSGSSNTLHIRYQSDGSIRDCVGNPVNKNDIAIVTLSFNKPANASTGMVECISGADRITLLDQVSEFNFHYLKQGAGSYESKDDGNVVVAVKYDIKFERRVVNSEGSLKRKYSQVAALRNVF